MKPVTPNFDRVDPAPLSGGIGMAPADVSEFVESCSPADCRSAAQPTRAGNAAVVPTGNEGSPGEQDLQPFPGFYGEPTPLQRVRQNVRFCTDPAFAARAIDCAQLEEIARLGT